MTVAARPKRKQAGPTDEGRADAENPETLSCDICRLSVGDDPLFVRGRDGEVRCWECRQGDEKC